MSSRPWDADYEGGGNAKNTLELADATIPRRPVEAVGAGASTYAAPLCTPRNHHSQNVGGPPSAYTDTRGHRDRLRSVSELPRCFQPLFKEFSYFNSVQSEMLEFVLSTSRSFVVSACLPPLSSLSSFLSAPSAPRPSSLHPPLPFE